MEPITFQSKSSGKLEDGCQKVKCVIRDLGVYGQMNKV